MKMFPVKLTVATLSCAGLLVLAGCNWPNIGENDPPDDFAQKALEKHHANGDMNDYQYQQSLKQFTPSDPSAQKPAGTAGTTTPSAPSTTSN